MLNSVILDTAIGLFFVYLTISIISSGISEFIADKFFAMRAQNMMQALRLMLQGAIEDKPSAEKTFLDDFTDNALFKNLAPKGKLPSYMSSKRFMQIVLDLITPNKVANSDGKFQPTTMDELAEAIQNLPDSHVRDSLMGILKQTDNKIETFQRNVEDWFDETMERASGWYKRRIRKFVFAFSMIIAIALNADTFHIIYDLSQDPDLRIKTIELTQQALELETSDPKAAEQAMALADQTKKDGLLGWQTPEYAKDWGAKSWTSDEFYYFWFLKCLGFFITALAASLGAPFWFDLLNKLVNIRNAGKDSKSLKQT